MSKIIPLASVCLLAGLGLGLTQSAPVSIVPLNVKTGLWENHTTLTVAGMMGLPPEVADKLTPEQRERYAAAMGAAGAGHPTETTAQGCVTQQDLAQDPTKMIDPKGQMNCKGEVVASSASDLELHTTCSGEAQMDMRIKLHAPDQEHITGAGTGSATSGGHTMTTTFKFDSHWLGATCPAGGGPGSR